MTLPDPELDADLVQRCRTALRELFPKPPTSISQLVGAARDVTGREVRIIVGHPRSRIDTPRGPLPSGLWARLDPGPDVVWIDGRTSRWHRLIVVCHEFGHIFLGHEQTAHRRDPELAATVEALLSGGMRGRTGLTSSHIAAMMGRCGEGEEYGSTSWTVEREAEIAGRFLAQRLSRRSACRQPLGL